ncbi:MAG: flippase [Candidatus Dormibacteraeota bacterium]|nr:flippase [Candidatus Dormibacteraeota bacterium]MBV9526350.1 flippase [Candidatus Dormibacteraeota bacterium]
MSSPPRTPAPAAPDGGGTEVSRPSGLGMRALRNTLLILVARVISRVIALVAVIIMGNSLGDTHFGEMQTAVTYVNLVGVFTDLGFSALYVREGARDTNSIARFFNNVASSKVVLSVVGLPMLFGLLYLAGLRTLLLPSFAILVLSGYQLLLRNSLYAMQQLTFEIIEIVPETAIVLLLVVLGARRGADSGYYLWAYAASYALACVYFGIVLAAKGVLRPRWRVETKLLRPWLRGAIPLGITFIITTVYFKVDVPILQRFRPYAEVGWYTFAYKPFESLLFIPFTLRGVVFPLLSLYHRRAPDRVLFLSEKFFKALVMLGWPVTVGVFLLASQFNDLLNLYPNSEPALQILALAIVFMFADNTFAATLNAIDKQTVFALVAVVGLVVNVGVNLVVIPRYGYIGASWAVVVTEAALVVVGWFVLRAQLGTINVVRSSWKSIVAGLVMGVFIYLVNPHGRVALFLVVVASAVIYGVILFALRAADAEEMSLIRNALRVRGT